MVEQMAKFCPEITVGYALRGAGGEWRLPSSDWKLINVMTAIDKDGNFGL